MTDQNTIPSSITPGALLRDGPIEVRHPDAQTFASALLTPAETHRILFEFNDTARPYDTRQTIVSLFESQVKRTPQSAAVTCQDETLTYQQLNDRANALAHCLRRHGVGPEVPVALCLERSLDLIVCVLAILKAGGAYVPLDPTYPTERLVFMLQDSNAALLLTRRSMLTRFGPVATPLFCLEQQDPRLARESIENPTPRALPQNLAYLIYTSGSTGRPKGVLLEHRNTVALIEWSRTVYTDADLAGVLLATSMCFDLSVYEIFVPLARGGRLIVVDDVLALPRLSPTAGVTLVNTVPTAIAPLLEYRGIPDSVRIINLAGELLPQDLVDRLYENTSAQAVYDLYGPTEATTYATGIRRTPKGLQTIGRPLTNWRTYILDEQRQPVPIGATGELYIGGRGVARGYHQRPELTAERFVPDPFTALSEMDERPRLYRTGDLARYRPDGLIEFLGRIDHQVKIHGLRIELGEIEAALATHPAVRRCVVDARRTATDLRLVAYVVLAPGVEIPSPATLRRHLGQRLPDYMVPRDVVFLQKFPQTPSGKIDRKALPAPERTQAINIEPTTRPTGATQETLSRLWCQLLKLDQIDPDAHFYDLGGDSLLAISLSLEIEKKLSTMISLTELFLAPTINQQVALIDNHQTRLISLALVPLQPHGARPPLFLLPGIGGHVIGLRDLAVLLGPDYPVYGLQQRGMDGRQTPHHRIQDMAAYFVDEITQQFPHGPYYLVGFSAGGLIAYEMAQQFRQRGQVIALLALLDTYGPDYPRLLPLPRRLGQHLRHLATLPLTAKGHYLADRWRGLARRFFPEHQSEPDPLHDLSGSIATAIASTTHGMHEALRDYRPHPYIGSIAVFQARDTPDWIGNSFDDPSMGWSTLVKGQVTTYRVPGDHLEIVRTPGVRVLAAHLRQTITQTWLRCRG